MNFLSVLLSALLIQVAWVTGEPYTVTKDGPQVKVSRGSLKGRTVEFRGAKVHQFLGIPFAEAPLNELRFKKPVPKEPWNGVINTDKWAPHCLQPIFMGLNDRHKFDEDCLVVNVFVTDGALREASRGGQEARPVMVWIHGGGFNFGSANDPDHYDGTALAGFKDVVVVSINYRLGAFGFLKLPAAGITGNMGLWDQRLALKWVQENIKYFGGDPSKVTIFGESAGSFSVSAQVVSPQSKGLFKNAIMQSGAIYDLDNWIGSDIDNQYLNLIGCSSVKDITKCLSSYKFGSSKQADDLTFWPIYGDDFLPSRPEDLVKSRGVDPEINVLLGAVGNEGALMLMIQDPITFHPLNPINLTMAHGKFILGKLFGKSNIDFYAERYLNQLVADDSDGIRLAVTKALGDQILACPTFMFGYDLANSGSKNVFAYYQTQRPAQGLIPMAAASKWLPATHCDDIPMVFGHHLFYPEKFGIEDATLAHLMMDVWTSFARGG